MIYINISDRVENSIPENFSRFPKFIKNIIYKIRKKLGILYIKIYQDKTLITISSINNNTLKRIEKYIRVKCIKRVCLSDELLKDKNFISFLEGQDIKIVDGKWLFDYIVPTIISYVVDNKKETYQMQEISILTQDVNDILVDNIRMLANEVKILNIITTKEPKLKKIEQELYEEKGIMLNINNNYKKSLLKSDIILNIDFSEEEFNKYDLPKKACVIQKYENIKIISKGFEGVNVLGYEISLPRKYLKYLINFKDFNNILLYESFIYKKTSSQNIRKEIAEDSLHILSLIGKNGKIRKSEFKNLSKNKNIS